MPINDTEAKQWQIKQAGAFGREVARLRKLNNLTAVELSAKTRHEGFPISRAAISKIENNTREGKVDVAEVAILAFVLRVTPVELLYPALMDGEAEVVPDMNVTAGDAALWFSGDLRPDVFTPVEEGAPDVFPDYPMRLLRQYEEARRWVRFGERVVREARQARNEEEERVSLERVRRDREIAASMREKMKQAGMVVSDDEVLADG